MFVRNLVNSDIEILLVDVETAINSHEIGCKDQSSSECSVRFEPNLRLERFRYVSERETNMQALKRLISLKPYAYLSTV